MAFCKNCGHKLADGAKFCENCGTAAGENDNTKRKAVYEGEIHKCPNCGEVLGALTAICPACGYELRGTNVSASVREISEQINAAPTLIQKTNIIQLFPIPNTKEDIFEFMFLAVPYLNTNPISSSRQKFYDAWLNKFEQCYQKATLLFSDDPDFNKIHNIYVQVHNNMHIAPSSVIKSNICLFIGIIFAIVSSLIAGIDTFDTGISILGGFSLVASFILMTISVFLLARKSVRKIDFTVHAVGLLLLGVIPPIVSVCVEDDDCIGLVFMVLAMIYFAIYGIIRISKSAQ